MAPKKKPTNRPRTPHPRPIGTRRIGQNNVSGKMKRTARKKK